MSLKVQKNLKEKNINIRKEKKLNIQESATIIVANQIIKQLIIQNLKSLELTRVLTLEPNLQGLKSKERRSRY
jgi:hypothetical protein